MKDKTTIIAVVSVLVLGIVIAIYFSSKGVTKEPLSEVISTNGLHWHSALAIYVKGEQIEIPANIGLGAVHNPIHTHVEDAPDGVIHLEFGGFVRKDNTKLGEFFKAWEKDITSFGSNMKMTVNGVENTEFENYFMQDGDKIELRYE